MERFDYHFPVRIHFGQGCFEESLRKEMKAIGERVMLAYGGGSLKRTGLYDRIVSILKEEGKTVIDFAGIMPNPTYAKVQEGAWIAREEKVDFILAVGGGSVSDCCKIVSAQARLDEDIWDMEYGKHQLPTDFLPMGVIVTASGTGSEQNNGAVITHEERRLKSALWGAFADFAILDPDLTKTVPMKQVISGAFDTLSHCMETYFGRPDEVNGRSSESHQARLNGRVATDEDEVNLSDEINEAVQRSVIRNIRLLAKNPDDDHARSELMWASAMGENGILKLGKQTDFQCHMLEHQLGAYTDCNHGQGLAVLHPALYRHIVSRLRSEAATSAPAAASLAKFDRWAQEVWLVEHAEDGIDFLADFIRDIGLPTTFSEMGITLDDATRRAIADSTVITPGSPVQLSAEELMEILDKCQ